MSAATAAVMAAATAAAPATKKVDLGADLAYLREQFAKAFGSTEGEKIIESLERVVIGVAARDLEELIPAPLSAITTPVIELAEKFGADALVSLTRHALDGVAQQLERTATPAPSSSALPPWGAQSSPQVDSPSTPAEQAPNPEVLKLTPAEIAKVRALQAAGQL